MVGEPVRVKLKMQWRYQEVREAIKVEHLVRKMASNE
jgi:hypothetical protein